MALYSAGEVGIDVLPVLDKFYAQLRAGLARVNGKDLKVNVGFNPNTALYDKTASAVDGRTFTNTVKFVSDDSGIKKIGQSIKKVQNDFSNLTFTPKINDTGFYKTVDKLVADSQKKMSELYNQTITGPQNVNDRYVNDLINKAGELYELTFKRKDLEKEYAKALSDEDTKAIKKYASAMVELDKNANKLRNELRKLHKLNSDPNFLDSSQFTAFRENIARSTPFVTRMTDSMKAADLQAQKLAKSNSFETEYLNAFTRAMEKGSDSIDAASTAFAKARQQAKEYRDQINDSIDTLVEYQKSLNKFQPFGGDVNVNRSLDKMIRDATKLNEILSKNPNYDIDISDFEEKYARVLHMAENMRSELEEKNDVKIRVDFLENNADKLEARIERMKHQRIDIPAEIILEQQKFIDKLHETSKRVQDDPSIKWEAMMGIDFDMKEAEKKIDNFQKEHDKLDMDLDLQTRLAQAHLAWFTRPRTVDIYADFKGTDLGKIINGMTSNATGIGYVNNQFQKLVNTMDSLDTIIPKWSLLGSTVLSIGAGLTNLAATVGGVGESLVMMSSAALAAPAALGGLTSAFVAGYYAVQTAKNNFDATTTSLNGLSDAVGNAAWEQFGDELYNLANNIAPTLKDGLVGIATAEGIVAANLMKIIGSADKTSELANVFSNTSQAVSNLDPGLQDIVTSFMTLGDVTSQYLPRMATYISNVSANFADWVREAENTGKITDSLEKAIEQGGYLVDIFGSFKGILSGTFGTLAQYENGLQGFSEAVASVDHAVNSVKFQDTFNELIAGAQTAQKTVRDSLSGVGDDVWSLRDEMRNGFEDAGTIVASVLSNISEMLADSDDGIRDFTDGLASGWSKAMDAIGDSGPVFSDLLSMVGQLADTFGGTFASTLRASAPLLEAMAKAAETVASAFDSLPEPVKSAIGLYATFGRAGKTALDTVKQSLLNNIQQTLQYRRVMNDLGITVSSSSNSFRELVSAWAALKTNNYDSMFASAKTNIVATGSALESASGKAGGFKKAIQNAGNMAKSAGSMMLNAVGGPQGLILTGAISALTMAWSDYNERALATEEANQVVIDSMSNVEYSTEQAASAISEAKSAISKNWDNDKYQAGGWDWLSDIVTGFDDAKEAADFLGISMNDLTDAATGTKDQYQGMVDKLHEIAESQLTNGRYASGNARETADAANLVLKVLQEQREKGWLPAEDAIRKYVKSADLVTDMSNDLQSSIADLSKSFEANGNTLDENTAGGQRNKKMLQDIASQAEFSAIKMLAYGEANGKTEEYTQKAVNAIYDARQAIIKAGEAAGMSEEEASAYADSLGLIPENVGTTITADTAVAKDQVEDYLNSLALTEGQRKIILELYDNGAIDDLKTLDGVIDALMGGKVSTKTLTLLLNADGDALWKTKNVEENLEALGMSKKTYEWLLSGKGNAEERMQKVRDALSDLNLTDKQIQWILDCIDKASGKMKDVEKQKVPAAKGVSFDITANPDQANNALAIMESKKLEPKTMFIDGDSTEANNVYAYIQALSNIIKWLYMYGNNDDATTKFNVADALQFGDKWAYMYGNNDDTVTKFNIADVLKFTPKWAYMYGNNDDVRNKMQQVRAYDHVTLAVAWGYINGNSSNWDSVRRAVASTNGSVIATNYVNVVSRSSGEVHAATGGRIFGPGTGTSDSVPAMLSNGEYVLRAKTVKQLDAAYGNGFLDYVNRMGKIPSHRVDSMVSKYRQQSFGYATGGRIRANDVQSVQKITTNITKAAPVYNTTQNIIYPAFAPTQITLNKKLDTAATYQM